MRVKAKQYMQVAKKFFVMISNMREHVYELFFRITAANNDRVTASGKTRITAKSDY